MTVPSQWEVALPVLKVIGEEKVISKSNLVEIISDEFNLSTTERSIRLKYGHTLISNRIGWAILNLRRSLLIETAGRGQYEITSRGREVLGRHIDQIDSQFLMQFKEFREFSSRKPSRKTDSTDVAEADLTPEQVLQNAHQEHMDGLASELSDTIKSCSPEFFEQLVVDLILAMGYGGSREDAGEAIGKTGDGGIDGVIREDKLGLDTIFIQAKRWNNSVSRPMVEGFVGSLAGKKARKGIMIATSEFTGPAKDYASNLEQKVILIGGQQLAELMIEYNIGVKEIGIYSIKRIDQDYFTEG